MCCRLKLLFCLAVVFLPSLAFSDIEGDPPQRLWVENRLRGSYGAIGSTLTLSDMYEYGQYNFYLLEETSASFAQEVPSDAKIKKAFLFWSGSTYDYPAVADSTATLKTPSGQVYSILADQCRLLSTNSLGNYYYCRADITEKVKGNSVRKGDSYTVGSIDAFISNNCDIDPLCQARYAGWALIVIWESQTFNRYRDIVIYDGFYHLDETTLSAGIAPPFILDGFVVGDPSYAELTFFGLEGDSQLGEPDQSLLPKTDPLYCVTCNDFIRVKRQGGSYIYLQNNSNPPNNIWNSSHPAVEASGVGVDIDTFNIGAGGLNVLRPGDTQLIVQPGVGDGFPVHPISGDPNAPDFNDSAAGGGESVFLGFVAIGLDTVAPIFENSLKHVDKLEASAQEVLSYTIDIINTGSADATNVVVTDLLPANTTYIPNSTYLDGSLVADVNGDSPLFSGMNINTVKTGVAYRRRITFKVKINENTPPGTYIYNRATIKCNEVAPFTTNQVSTLVKAATVAEFTKRVVSIVDQYGMQKGFAEPGDSINYEVRIKSGAGFPITIERFEDIVPKHTRILDVSVPPGSIDNSTSTSIIVNNISFDPYGTQYIRYTLRIDTVSEWGNSDPINGYQIKNQGRLSGGSLDRDYYSDDPTTPSTGDPTVVTVRYGSDLSSSSKSVQDLNGGKPEPGDELLYTVNVRNTGRRTVSIQVEDTLSVYAEFVAIESLSPASMKYSINGNNLTFYNFQLATNETATIKYRVRIGYSIPPGNIEFKNIARISSLDEPNYYVNVSTSLTVVSGPIISVFQKGAKIGGVESRISRPGDMINYYITIRNTGNGAANNLVIEDTIDNNLLVDTSSISDGGTFSQGKIVWQYLSIGVNQIRTLSFAATVKIPIENNTLIRNQALLYSQDISRVFSDDPSTSALGDSTDITVRFNPSIKNSYKFVNGAKSIYAHGGDIVTFRIEFENDSPGPLRNVVLSDSVSRLLTNIELITSGGVVDGNQNINWSIPLLNYQEKKVFEFRAEVRPPTKPSTVILNYATVILSDVYNKSTDTVTIYVYDEPNLTNIFKYASYDGDYAKRTHNANAGDTLVFSIIFKNSGPVPATGVRIRDPLDQKIVSVSDISNGGYKSGNEIIWDIGSLQPNEEKRVFFKGVIKSPLPNKSQIANQARITSNETKEILSDDPDTLLAHDPLIITISSAPFLVIHKSASDENGAPIVSPVRAGQIFNFGLSLINTGNAVANDIVVADFADTDRYEILEILNGGYKSGNQVIWNLSSLEPGESNRVELSFKVRVKECISGSIINYAEVTGREILNPQRSNTLTLGVDNLAKKGRFIKRLISAREIDARGNVIYELGYTTDDISLCDVVITDVFSDDLRVTSVSDGYLQGNTLTIKVKELRELKPVRVEAKIKIPIKDGTIIKNQAYIEASNYKGRLYSDDPDTSEMDDPTELKVISSPEVYMVKTADVSEVSPGGTINYSILVINTGTDYGRDIVVTDSFRDMYSYITDVITKGEGVYDHATHTLAFDLASLGLAPQYYKRYEFAVRVKDDIPDGTILSNQSRLAASNIGELFSDNNIDRTDGVNKTEVRVVNRPDIEAIKIPYRKKGGIIGLNEYVYPDEEYQYKIVLRNNSDVVATDIVVTDYIDNESLRVMGVNNGGVYDGSVIRFEYTNNSALKSLKKGDQIELSYLVKVDLDVARGTQIRNRVKVVSSNSTLPFTGDDGRTPQKNDDTIVVVDTRRGADFSTSTKDYIVNNMPVRAGDRVDFVITVYNSGDETALETTLFDNLTNYGWRYVAGSTKLNGEIINDKNGRSPLEYGLRIRSARYMSNPQDEGKVSPVSDGGKEINGAVVEFSAIVPENVSIMKNGAKITYRGGEYTIPEVEIPVGERPFISTLKKEYSLLSDKNGNSVADEGDSIRFYLRFINEGYIEAKRVEITDILPSQASYIAGSMSLRIDNKTKQLTDDVDGDEGEITTINGSVANRFVIQNLAPHKEVLVTFDAVVNVCGGFLNQAELVYDNGRVLSDYDGNSSNGIQKTFVATCEISQTYFELYKTATDMNRGNVEPSDNLRFRISVVSQSNGSVDDLTFMDDIPQYVEFSGRPSDISYPLYAQFSYVPPPAGRFNNGLIIIKGLRFDLNNNQTDIGLTVRVKKDVQYGSIIENKAVLYTKDNRYFESNTVRLTVGSRVGSTSIQGILFRKMNKNENYFDMSEDILLKGYRITATKIQDSAQARPPPSKFIPPENILTDESGKFTILNLDNARYILNAYNEKGYSVGRREVDLSDGSLVNVRFAIVPSGVIYSSDGLQPLSDILLTLTDSEGNKTQFVTGRDGIYWFDFENKRYTIGASSPNGKFSFPSVRIPPDGRALPDKDGYISNDFFPAALKERRYSIDLDLSKTESEIKRIVNNNIPLDPTDSLIVFYKTSNKNVVQKGDLLEYSLFVRNETSNDITAYITDEPDNPLVIKSREFSIGVQDGTGFKRRGSIKVKTEKYGKKMLYRTEMFNVSPRETVVIRYFAYTGFEPDVRRISNRATLILSTGLVLKSAYNTVLLEKERELENSIIFGRLFCDENSNDRFDSGEMPIGSARIMLDTGYIGVTDIYGKYHFPVVAAGYHIVKIDSRSLPAGVEPVNESVEFFFTNGLPARINFPLKCNFNKKVISPSDLFGGEGDFSPLDSNGRRGPVATPKVDNPGQDISLGNQGVSNISLNTGLSTEKATAPANTDVDSGKGEKRIRSENIIYLPSSNRTSSERVLIYGMIDPSCKLYHKDSEIKTDNGRFRYEIPLVMGKNKIVLDIIGPKNEKGSLFYEVERVEGMPFVLAYATTTLSNSNYLPDGYLPSTHATGYGIGIDGKAVIYAKHHMKDRLGFKDIDITLHFDSSKMREREFVLLENRLVDYIYYPASGDSSALIRDVNAIDKLYLRVEADKNRLLFGNYNSSITGIEQFRYERELYGISLTLDNRFERYHTDNFTRVFAGIPVSYSQHKRTIMKATGGSVYFIGSPDVISGSENLRVVVRDSLTGDILTERLLTRYTDYTINYTTGTVMLNQPLTTYTSGSTTLSMNTTDSADIYLIAEYDYFSLRSNDNYSIGGYIREDFDNRLSLSAGIVNEFESEDTRYRLMSVGLSYRYLKYSLLKAEIAKSISQYSDYLWSFDGGISGRSLSVEGKDGYSILFMNSGDIADLFIKDNKILDYRLLFRMNTPYFMSSGTMLNQGLMTIGADLSKRLSDRFDGSINFYTHTIEPLNLTTMERAGEINLYQSQQRLNYRLREDLKLIAENIYYYADFNTEPLKTSYSTDILGVGANYQATNRISLFGSVHSVFLGSSDEFKDIYDRLFITLGSTYKVRPKLYLTLSDTLRFNLDNYTQISARTPISETGSIYLGERIGNYNSQLIATSILGAEEQLAAGISSYGEYQVDTLSNQLNSKAILGTKGRFAVADGINANISYEHTEVVSQGDLSYNYTEPNLLTDPNLNIIHNYSQATQKKGPLYGYSYTQRLSVNSSLIYDYMGLNYPLGFAEGDNKRDVISASIEYVKLKNIKASFMGEFRYDNNDENYNGEDRIQYLTRLSLIWGITRDLSITFSGSYLNVSNLRYDRDEYRFNENSFGLALRPVDLDRVNLFIKYSNVYEDRYDLFAKNSLVEYSHILSIVPVVELPYGFEIIEKLALKRSYLRDSSTESSVAIDTLLLINRLNYSFYRRVLDIGVEYRILSILDNETRSGFLFDIGYSINKYFRLAAGYNFTDFSDDLYRMRNYSYNGLFLRATGKY